MTEDSMRSVRSMGIPLLAGVLWTLALACSGGGSGGDEGSSTPSGDPSISSFIANPTVITLGGTATLTGFFVNGTGAITPGNIPVASGKTVQITPDVTTSYTLTVTGATGTSVTQTAGITVVPAGADVITPDLVQASGIQQTTSGGTFSNGPIVGESFPAKVAASLSNTLQVRHGFHPPVPPPSN